MVRSGRLSCRPDVLFCRTADVYNDYRHSFRGTADENWCSGTRSVRQGCDYEGQCRVPFNRLLGVVDTLWLVGDCHSASGAVCHLCHNNHWDTICQGTLEVDEDEFHAVWPYNEIDMDFLELATRRFSVREFSSRPVEEEKITKILQAAKVAPTAVNYQSQKIFVNQRPGEVWLARYF